MAGKHPGFAKAASQIAKKEGVSSDRAAAMLASSTRKASPAARRKNPKLNKVKGSPFAKAAKKAGGY